MKNIIYIKYGELVLKGKNKINFINRLFDNVKRILADKPKLRIIKQFDSMIITGTTVTNRNKIIDTLKKVPGIGLIIPGFVCKRDFDSLSKSVVEQLEKASITDTTFKVDTRRADKAYPLNSMEVSRKLGGVILKRFKKYHVDVHTPKLHIIVEIKLKNAIFYFEKIKGCGGFPLGINGRVLMLISGGIDSPVAASLLLKKGLKVDFLTFISPPHTDDRALNKVRSLQKILTFDGKLYKSKLYIVNFTSLQHEISHISNHSYQITLMRRYFFRIAKDLAIQNEYDAIATGESIGQVASQTIESMNTIQQSINGFLVLRPLLSYDKQEIIEIAKRINTYNTSILPFADSCSLFVPTNPVTKPTPHSAKKLEDELTLIEGIYDNVFKKHINVE